MGVIDKHIGITLITSARNSTSRKAGCTTFVPTCSFIRSSFFRLFPPISSTSLTYVWSQRNLIGLFVRFFWQHPESSLVLQYRLVQIRNNVVTNILYYVVQGHRMILRVEWFSLYDILLQVST